jgi:hypothetical protein
MGFWNAEGPYAYAVISGSLTAKLTRQSVIRTGTLAYTFGKQNGKWKIEAQALGAHFVAGNSLASGFSLETNDP